MEEKNPFLVEPPVGGTSKYMLLRDTGAFRGLVSLFPAANLHLLTKIVSMAATSRLPTGVYRIPPSKESYRRDQRRESITSRAVLALSRSYPEEEKPLRTWQNHLDLACDMRILMRTPQQYVVHPYGQPLAFLARGAPECIAGNQNWQAFFIDRLLYEDGSWIQAVLSVIATNYGLRSSKIVGLRMHEKNIDKIQEILESASVTRWAAMQLREIQRDIIRAHSSTEWSSPHKASRHSKLPMQIKTPFEFDIEEKQIPRRTELEYTVRRDWLIELGLIQMQGDVFRLTPAGEKLKEYIDSVSNMKIDFFTRQIGHVLAALIQCAQFKKPAEAISVLEDLFVRLTQSPLRITQTLILINTAIFSSLPIFYGERQDILEALCDAIKNNKTKLTLQSAQRVRYYYVKAREGLFKAS